VLLYFIVRVEVIEIQISFEFKLICNLQNRFEKEKNNFLIRNRLRAELHAAQPATPRAHGLRGPAGLRRSPTDSWARTT
jgi:hypothetical protein